MSQSRPLDVGLDVHQESIAVAYGAPAPGAEVTSRGTVGTRQCDLDHLIRNRPSKATHLVLVDDAGPCGSWRSRDLTKQGYDCWVVAPALIPPKAGARVTTDRRAAGQVARLARSGALPPVDVPTVDDEAMRDLTRAREETRSARQDAQCRLNAFLLRHEIRDPGRATWTPAHRRWRAEVVCPTPAPHIVCQASVRAVTAPPERLQRLDQERQERVTSWRVRPEVDARQAWRGVQCTVAVTMVAALGDRTRVDTPSALMKCLGLMPSEDSTGARRRHGSLTNAGHTHARRARVEGAWASRDPANVSRPLQLSLAQPPNAIQDISWKAQVRRCHRYRTLRARGQHANQVVVAMARALIGLMWAMAKAGPVAPEASLVDDH